MKLKIIVNKMNHFINKIVDLVTKKRIKIPDSYKINYFKLYSDNIEKLSKERKIKIEKYINDNPERIDSMALNDIVQSYSVDTSNCCVKGNVYSYIVYCIYMTLMDDVVKRLYYHDDVILNVGAKDRPDTYLCKMYKEGVYITDMYLRVHVELPGVIETFKRLERLKMLPFPYCIVTKNYLVYEALDFINPEEDALIDVLKDTVNQIKNVNKHYNIQYFDKSMIGRSRLDFKRYYINCIDTMLEKNDNVFMHNVYDGRVSYNKVTEKDQLRALVNMLSEMYVTGNDTYVTKNKLPPFCDYLSFIESCETNVSDKFIQYLMGIKNE